MIRIYLDFLVVVDEEALVMMQFSDYYGREIRPEGFFILRGEDLDGGLL